MASRSIGARRAPPVAPSRAEPAPAVVGLTSAEVQQQIAAGRTNAVARTTSRTLSEIVHANVFTRFNALLGGLLVVILLIGPAQDALFGIVLVTNAVIGIAQEWRAKRVLDRLSLVHPAQAHAVRDGVLVDIPPATVVLDDVVEVRAGEQVPVDGRVVDGDIEVDEALLSGESEPVARRPGDDVLAASVVTAGRALVRATAVGPQAYVNQLAGEAKVFRMARSALRDGIDTILQLVTWAIVPTAILLVSSQLSHAGLVDALRGSVAGIGSMVPEGLVLLTSTAFAVAVIRLGRRHALVQELGAVEGLARVDVLCLDKTGTITSGALRVHQIDPLGDDGLDVTEVLAAIGAADETGNSTARALAAMGRPPGWATVAQLPFSSARKWGATAFDGHGTWIIGGADVLVRLVPSPSPALLDHIDELARQGLRVLLLAGAGDAALTDDLPAAASPAALVVLDEELRPDAADTLAYFADAHVEIKVISGDDPRTVGAIAARVGLGSGREAVDARTLPAPGPALDLLVDETAVFGRTTPAQKREIVASLHRLGRTVAMTGDGVNDVLALKDADLGVAVGSGAPAARAVAKVVLLDDSFASLPAVVAEGRRVIANVERVANLFVTKTAYALVLAVAVGVAGLPFPFLPRHLTIVSSLTIGIPGFFLALQRGDAPARGAFVGRTLRFALPAGSVAAAATLVAYRVADDAPGTTLPAARTAATIALFAVATWVLSILARPFDRLRAALVGTMPAAFVVLLAVPWVRSFFALPLPPLIVLLSTIGVAAIGIGLLEGGWRASTWLAAEWRRRQRAAPQRTGS